VRRVLVASLVVTVVLALAGAATSAPTPFQHSIRPLSARQQVQLTTAHDWHPGCPVSLSQLRLLSVSAMGWDGRPYVGQLVVNADVARPLVTVFRKLYALRFPIRHMTFAQVYGPARYQPRDNDVSGSFQCRDAVPSPCTGGKSTGHWSNHAYGHAIDLNPTENPYVGCGMTHDPTALKYVDRSPLRRGMITPAVLAAFQSIGWGWGGSWAGSTKDYMHFSTNGH
jgi:D-alanyl-D-alanine carboxypeptidase-like protein